MNIHTYLYIYKHINPWLPWLIRDSMTISFSHLIHNHSQWFMIQDQFGVHHRIISPWLNMIELARPPRQINGCHSRDSLRYHNSRDSQGLYQATCSSHELDYGAGSKHHESGWAEGSIHGEGLTFLPEAPRGCHDAIPIFLCSCLVLKFDNVVDGN